MENNFSEEVQRHLKGAKKVVESLPEVAGNVTKSWSLPEILSENFSGSLAKKFTGSDNLLKEIAIKVTGEFASGDNLLVKIAIKATGKFATVNFYSIEFSLKPIVFPAHIWFICVVF